MTQANLTVADTLIIRNYTGKDDNQSYQNYQTLWQAMHDFTDSRQDDTLDEVWLVEHNPVFTQGQAGKAEHLLNTGDIPVIQSDRGGQVTYHGPGQLVVYFMLNLRRKNIGVRQLVTHIESIVIDTLADFGIQSQSRPDAPGVYVLLDGQDQSQPHNKICSLGLRVRRGCSFHGLALNINMDLAPFLRINPCGYAGMEMVQMQDYLDDISLSQVEKVILEKIAKHLDYKNIEFK